MDKKHTGLTAPKNLLKSSAIPIVIGIVAIFAYLNGINGEFIFDDIPLVKTDAFYSDAETSWLDCWQRCYWRKGMELGQYRPLTLLSFLVNTRLIQLYYPELAIVNFELPEPYSPLFRIFNIVLHVIISLLVYKLALKLRFGKVLAIFAGLLFAVHPLHSEAVIPTFARAELLCALFIILGLLFHISSYKTENQSQLKIPSSIFHILTALCFILACWSKENGVILLPLCVLYDLFYEIRLKSFCYIGKDDKCGFECPICILIKKYWMFAISLGIVVLTRVKGTGMLIPKLQAGTNHVIDNPLIGAPIFTRIMTAFHVQGIVIYKFFWPSTLSHDYSYKQIMPVETILDPFPILAIFFILCLPVILCLVIPKRKNVILFLWGAYIVSILPAGNFITPTGTIFGERLYYTPSIWFIFITLYLLFVLVKSAKITFPLSRYLLYGILIISIIASIFRIYIRAEDLRNTWNLAISAVKGSPNSIKTWNNLAKEYGLKGEYKNALMACDKGLSIVPDNPGVLKNKIYFLVAMKRLTAAEKLLRKIIKMGSTDPEMFNLLGGIVVRDENYEEAEKLWQKSIVLKPEQPKIKKALKDLKEIMGDDAK